jgi:hypothetical protein
VLRVGLASETTALASAFYRTKQQNTLGEREGEKIVDASGTDLDINR